MTERKDGAGWRFRLALVGKVLLLANVLLAATFNAPRDASAGGGRGSICNRSGISVVALVEDNINSKTGKGQWRTISFAPGACSNSRTQDVEGIWGNQCDARGRCQQTAFKLGAGSYTITTVKNSGRKWPVVSINGRGWNSGWGAPTEWPRPQMSLAYEIRH